MKHVSTVGAKAVHKARRATPKSREEVPGPTADPATNLIMADIAIRAGSYIVRRSVEKGLLRGRYGRDTAQEIVKNRPMKHTIASFALAKIATKNLPGALVVGAGLLGKSLLDRRKSRLREQAEGDERLMEQARDEG